MSTSRKMRVKIRRIWPEVVRPHAEAIDGRVFEFVYGYHMDDEDRYPGEIAWYPEDVAYPKGAPVWIASGDLQAEGET